MKLTFLGTGTSVGIPQMRCRCETCTSTDPHDNRLRASALLEIAPGAPGILIDCGPDFRQQMLREGSPDLAAAIITHTHYDHLGGIDDLRPYCATAPDHNFPLYCRADVAHDLRTRIPYCFAKKLYPGVPTFDIHEIDAPEPFEIAIPNHTSVIVEPLRVIHGKLTILGYKIGNLAYITDASELPAETIEAIKGIDTLVINALRHEEHPSHLNLLQALNVINMTAPRQAFLTHMSHHMGPEAKASKLLPRNTSFAFDGLSIEIID